MSRALNSFFSPQSVAVIGASRTPTKVGAVILKNIIDSGFLGKIYPVNPQAESINDLKCYPDIKSLPEIPDLTIIVIPAAFVAGEVEKIGR